MPKVPADGRQGPGVKHEEIYRELQQQFDQGKWRAGQRFPTERELAEQYHVSRPTISRVVNRLRDTGQVRRVVGAGTFVTVEEANPVEHRTFGLFVPGLGRGEIFEPICSRIAERSHEFNFSLIWGSMPAVGPSGGEDRLFATARRFVDRDVDGVFYQPIERDPEASTRNERIIAMLEDAGMPIVLLDSDYLSYPARSLHDLVGIDNARAAFILTNHLLRTGAPRVDFLSQPFAGGACLRRVAGYREALVAAGISPSPEFEHIGDPQSLPFVREIVQGGAADIVCENDETATFLLITLERLALRVPRDVRIAGFDDVKYARLARVPLTTMRQPCSAIGDIAVQTMAARVAYPDLPPRTVCAEAELCVRESTGGSGA
ncbi:GntR family transcriptional regulator [Salinispira pacifica]